MGNLCTFSFQMKGRKDGIEKLVSAIRQKKGIWVGHGASLHFDSEGSIKEGADGFCTIQGGGSCNSSCETALNDNALSMQRQKKTGEGYWADLSKAKKIMTLGEACKEYGVNIEIYSEEPDCEFAEHIIIADGKETWDSTRYTEDYNEETDEWTSVGGYGNDWKFCIGNPAVA